MTVGLALVVLLPVVALVFLAVYQDRKTKRLLQRIAKAIGGSVSGKALSGTHEGTPYQCEYVPGSRYSAPSFRVRLRSTSSGSFRVVHETGFDRLFKGRGVTSEIKTGDPDFDREFYVLSDTAAFATAVFLATEKRQAVREIFRRDFTEVSHDGGMLEAKWSPFQLKEDFDPSVVTATVSCLAALAKGMPIVSQPTRLFAASGWKTKKALTFALPWALLAAGLAALILGPMWFQPLDASRLLRDSLKYSLSALAAFLGLAVTLLKGRSSSHRELGSLLLLSLVAFPVAGFGLEVVLNGWLDPSSAASHTAPALGKHTSSSRSGTHYHVQVESWRAAGRSENLEVPSALYRAITPPHTHVTVLTKPGRFGFEWVVSVALAPGGAASAEEPSPPDDAHALETRVKQILAEDNVSQRRDIDEVFALADLYAARGDGEGAMKLYEEALRVDSWRLDYQLKLARLLKERGRNDEAAEKVRIVSQYAEEEGVIAKANALLAELGAAPVAEPEAGEQNVGTSGEIVLVPIGDVNRRLLDELRGALQQKMGMTFSLVREGLNLGTAQRSRTERYLTEVVGRLKSTLPPAQFDALLADARLGEDDLVRPDAKRAFIEQVLERTSSPEQRRIFQEDLERLEGEGQFDAARFVAELKRRYPPGAQPGIEGYLGVTEADLFSGDANFLFGLAVKGYGVMSYHRFLARINGEPPNRPRLRGRSVKQALSSSFFILGIPRCTSPICARAYPHNLTEHDQKSAELCTWCKEQLRTHLHPGTP